MSEKILFVDDDAFLLAACERNLRRKFQVETAIGGEAGLKKIGERGPFAVVVADRQMPGMDGVQFLSAVWKMAPDTVRMMLTGNVDLEQAIKVVNEGNIFRFLTKPCPPDVLNKALDDAIHQYGLVMAEKELLNKTLNGSVKLLTEILSLLEPQSFGQTQTMRELITNLARQFNQSNEWEIQMATMLAPIGYVTVPPETLVRMRSGRTLTPVEETIRNNLPETAAKLLMNIPRLESVAQIVRFQHKNFNGSGLPADPVAGEKIPFGARLLKILTDLNESEKTGMTRAKSLDEMQQRTGWYDPVLLQAVRGYFGLSTSNVTYERPSIPVSVSDLTRGMVLRTNLETKDGTLILAAGHQIGETTLEVINNFAMLTGVKEPIFVEAP
jgi:response regulator RpfG family c-di-GMP phosphodiesterase